LELHFCGARRSRGLNRKWRQKDKEGDVLSFPLQESVPEGFRGHLGSLLLDWPYVKRHAGRFAPELHEELAFLILHGLLHLCGQHHDSVSEEAKMWRLMNSHFPPPAALLRELKKSIAHVL
jgi:probable rRNA maturation factor